MSKRFPKQHGTAMVEFAIVLPLMLFLTLAVTELGRAMLRYNTLTKSVQDGARHLASHALFGSSGGVRIDDNMRTETRNLVVYGNAAGTGVPLIEGLDPSQVTISEPAPLLVQVDVAYPYVALFGPVLTTFGLGSSTSYSFVMQASVTMRAL